MAVGLKAPHDVAPVNGVCLATTASGTRYQGRDDLLLMLLDDDATVSAVFTRNRYCAAPVTVAKDHLSQTNARALLINAGNANAGTGKQGLASAQQSCDVLANELGCQPNQVLPFSTGVIGVQLPMPQFSTAITEVAGIASQADWQSADWVQAAEAIMTTDTIAKAYSVSVEIGGKPITVSGIAKGSGMICPDMATMLAYIATDACVDQTLLDRILRDAVDASFNRITVDGDTSTNDACVLIATNKADHIVFKEEDSAEAAALRQAVSDVAIQLAQAIIRDGEGATKFVEVAVSGGASQQDCAAVAYTVAHSPLVKTALFASDPNWGRLLAAIGRAPVEQLVIEHVDIAVNGVAIITGGEPDPSYTEEAGQTAFNEQEITLAITLGQTDAEYTVWTTDLSHEYVTINAEYRS